MSRWQYMIVDSKDVAGGGVFRGKTRSDVEAYLNRIGKDEWEIVNLDFRELEGRFEFSGVAKRKVTA